jgi:amino acid adenylation domain-containing protein
VKEQLPREYYSITEPQKRIWYTQEIYPESSMFSIGGTVCMQGNIDIPCLKIAISIVMNHYDVFSIRLSKRNDEVVQYFMEEQIQPEEIPFVDFHDFEKPQEKFKEWVNQCAHSIYQLYDTRLYGVFTFEIQNDYYGVLLKMHHIIADGWSFALFAQKVNRVYESLKESNETTELEHYSYKNCFVNSTRYLQSNKYVKDQEFWKKELENAKEIENTVSKSLSGRRKTYSIDADHSAKIRNYTTEKHISLNTFYTAVYMMYVYKISGQTDQMLGIPVLGRSNSYENNTVGMFVSTMPFSFQISKEESLENTVQLIEKRMMNCFYHQKYPYNHMVKDLSLSGHSLYDTCINYYKTNMSNTYEKVKTTYKEFYNGEQEYTKQFIVREWNDDSIQIDVDYKLDVYDETAIDRMMDSMNYISMEIINHTEKKVSELCLMNEADRESYLIQYNQTEVVRPDKTVIDLYEEQVITVLDKTAVYDKDVQVSYRQLEMYSNQVAAYIHELGYVGTNVAICLENSIDTIAAILGILKSGNAYVPIDIKTPVERMQYILSNSKTELLIVKGETGIKDQSEFHGRIVPIETIYSDDEISFEPIRYERAYIIYTSGTTGKPKGVIIGQKSLLNYIMWAKNMYVSSNQEVFPLYTSIGFDLTVTSIFTPLVSGNSIAVYRDDQEKYFVERIVDDAVCTIMKLTPAHLILLKDRDNTASKVRQFIVGGDKLMTQTARQVTKSFGGNVRIFNEYGPTEATVGCMIHLFSLEEDCSSSVPIGVPIDNTRLFILDQDGYPAALGSTGELYIGGDCLAFGYRSEENAADDKFLLDERYGGRIYKTGDLVYFDGTQCMNYIGRMDQQTKINGYRIELKEIETCLQEYPGIKSALAATMDINGTQILCAYYVSYCSIDCDQVKKNLEKKLNDYMIPKFFIALKEIPLTYNGKVDYHLLPKPDIPKEENEIWDVNSKKERVIYRIYSEILELEEIKRTDNFFYLGGDSIKAIQIRSRLRDEGYLTTVSDIIEHPVISEIVEYVKAVQEEDKSTISTEGEVALTPIIQWFFHQYAGNPNQYLQCCCLKMKQNMENSTLDQIFSILLENHDALRLNYDGEKKVLFYNNNPQETAHVEEYIVSNAGEEKETIDEVVNQLLNQQMDITKDRLIRSYIIRTELEDYWIFIAHHLVIDGVSWDILFNDIQTLLGQWINKEPLKLPSERCSYKDYSEYLYQKGFADRAALVMNDSKRSELCKRLISLDRKLSSALLKEANDSFRTKPNELLIAAMYDSIAKLHLQDQISVILESHGRSIGEEEINLDRTVGWFTDLFMLEEAVKEQDLFSRIIDIKEKYRKEVKRRSKDRNIPWNQVKNDSVTVSFNYLGNFNKNYRYFQAVNTLDYNRNNANDVNLDILVVDGVIILCFNSMDEISNEVDLDCFIHEYIESLNEVVRICMEQNECFLSPSDFDTVEFTQQELASIFQ